MKIQVITNMRIVSNASMLTYSTKQNQVGLITFSVDFCQTLQWIVKFAYLMLAISDNRYQYLPQQFLKNKLYITAYTIYFTNNLI